MFFLELGLQRCFFCKLAAAKPFISYSRNILNNNFIEDFWSGGRKLPIIVDQLR